jgi:hypothetical protein
MTAQARSKGADRWNMNTTTLQTIKSVLVASAIAGATVASAVLAVPGADRAGEGSMSPASDVAAVVSTTTTPATTAPTTTSSSVKPVQAVRQAHRVSHQVTGSTLPAEMPAEIAELQKRIPDDTTTTTEAEMAADDCEFIHGCNANPDEATDWIE